MKIFKKIAMSILLLSSICVFFIFTNLTIKNNVMIEEIPCYIKEIEDVKITHNPRNVDTMELSVVISYEREREYVEEEIILSPRTEKDKEFVFGLEKGDTITLNNTVYGLSMYTHNLELILVIIFSFVFAGTFGFLLWFDKDN